MLEGFDIGLEMSGQPAALSEMMDNMTHGGRIALLGLPSQPVTLDLSARGPQLADHSPASTAGRCSRPGTPCRCWCRRVWTSAGDHPPVPGRRVRAAFEVARSGRLRQGRPRLGVADPELKGIGCARPCTTTSRPPWPRSAPPACTRPSGSSPARRAPHIRLGDVGEVINLCANNYLGLADHPAVVAAAKAALDEWGFGMASVRFICGTQDPAQAVGGDALGLPRHRRHDPLQLLLRRQRRPVRVAARAVGRGHLRRAEPRQHHRRHPPVQGATGCATATATWPTSRPSSRPRRAPGTG